MDARKTAKKSKAAKGAAGQSTPSTSKTALKKLKIEQKKEYKKELQKERRKGQRKDDKRKCKKDRMKEDTSSSSTVLKESPSTKSLKGKYSETTIPKRGSAKGNVSKKWSPLAGTAIPLVSPGRVKPRASLGMKVSPSQSQLVAKSLSPKKTPPLVLDTLSLDTIMEVDEQSSTGSVPKLKLNPRAQPYVPVPSLSGTTTNASLTPRRSSRQHMQKLLKDFHEANKRPDRPSSSNESEAVVGKRSQLLGLIRDFSNLNPDAEPYDPTLL